MELIEQAKQSELQFSHAETKEHFSNLLTLLILSTKSSPSPESLTTYKTLLSKPKCANMRDKLTRWFTNFMN